jgi:type IV secretory pathway VirB4 component
MNLTEISEILPFVGFEEKDKDGSELNALFTKDGRICFVFEVNGSEYEKWKPEDYKKTNQIIEAALREMPVHTTLQKTDIYYKEKNNMQPGNDTYVERKRCEHFNKRASIKHKAYLSLSFASEKMSRPSANSTFLAKKGKHIPFTLLKEAVNRINYIASKTNSFQAQLNQIPDVEFVRLKEDQIKSVLCQYLNLDFKNDNETEVYNMIHNNNDFIKIGHKMVNVVSLVGQSEEVFEFGEKAYFSSNFFNPFANNIHFDLQIPHIVNTTITKVDVKKSLKDYKTEVLISKQIASNSPMGKKSSARSELLETELALVEERKDGFVECSISLVIYSDNVSELRGYRENCETAIKGMSQAKYLNESFDAQNIFFAGLPGNGWENVRCMKMPTYNSLPYFHFQKPYVSDKNGEIFTDRYGVPVRIDLNRPDLTSRNRILVGPTGSGKSFTEGTVICTSDERKEIQIIIDKGGTYKQLMVSLNGHYLEHKEGSPMRFNPFAIDKDADGNYILTDDKTVVLQTFLSLLWKSKTQNEFVNKAESSFLYDWIRIFYDDINEKKEIPTLKKFTLFIKEYDQKKRAENDTEYLQSIKFFEINHFVTVLKPFTDGIYKDIFNNETSMNLADHKLLCFDLEGIQKDETLYPIVTMLIIDLVFNHINKYPHILKHIILDEAWSFFTGEMSSFIGYMYRTIRKQNGTVTIITQSAQDILDSELANALIQNTQVFIILDHKGKTTVPLTKMGIDPINVKKIETIRKNWQFDNGYGEKVNGGREIYVQREDKSFNIYAMEVPIEQYVLLTSTATERDHFRKLIKEYPVEIAIELWKIDKEKGKFLN